MTDQPIEKNGSTATLVGLGLIVLALALGTFQAKFPVLLWNSALVTGGSLAISLPLGAVVGWLLGWVQVRGRTVWLSLLVAWAATPLIIQVSAWDALWGRLSWWAAIDQVRYLRWFDGPLAVIWIHGFANLPWAALFFTLSRQWLAGDTERFGQTRMDLCRTMLLVSFPRLLFVFLTSAVLIGLRTFEQFDVTDVYQVRTWAEIWYLGFSLGEFDAWSGGILPSTDQLVRILGTPSPNIPEAAVPEPIAVTERLQLLPTLFTPLLLILGVAIVLANTFRRFLALRENTQEYVTARLNTYSLVPTTVLLILVAAPMAVQVINLVIRLGVRADWQNGEPIVQWTTTHAWEMLTYSAQDYRDAFQWSMLIGGLASLLICFLSFSLAWSLRRKPTMRFAAMMLGLVLLAVPAPLVSLAGYRWINLSDLEIVRTLAATSVLSPVVALTTKYFGFGLLIWSTILSREANQREDLLRLSGGTSLTIWWQFGLTRYWPTGLAILVFLTLVLSGDLATTFATVPPGMDTLARRLLGDLHAGAGAQVAAACLIQSAAIAIGSLFLGWRLSRDQVN